MHEKEAEVATQEEQRGKHVIRVDLCPVQQVTVYNDRAEVTRLVPLPELPPGATRSPPYPAAGKQVMLTMVRRRHVRGERGGVVIQARSQLGACVGRDGRCHHSGGTDRS